MLNRLGVFFKILYLLNRSIKLRKYLTIQHLVTAGNMLINFNDSCKTQNTPSQVCPDCDNDTAKTWPISLQGKRYRYVGGTKRQGCKLVYRDIEEQASM